MAYNITKYHVLFIGDSSKTHLSAMSKFIDNHISYKHNPYEITGFGFINHEDPEQLYDIFKKRMTDLKDLNIHPIIMKSSGIHTEDFIRPIIKYLKEMFPGYKTYLTHCAVFTRECDHKSRITQPRIILTDAALMANYTLEKVSAAITNALPLTGVQGWTSDSLPLVALLNAGGETNKKTMPEQWISIVDSLNKYRKLMNEPSVDIEVSQLDSALSSDIKSTKLGIPVGQVRMPNIIVPSSINEGNSIWKALTLNGYLVSGIVLGSPLKIGLLSRTDTEESIVNTLKLLTC